MKKLELKINNLEKDKFEEIEKYIASEEFQNDFPCGYWEGGSKGSGKILEITTEKIPEKGIYRNITVKLRDDEDMNYGCVMDNIGKLGKHYQKIIGIMFSKPNTL